MAQNCAPLCHLCSLHIRKVPQWTKIGKSASSKIKVLLWHYYHLTSRAVEATRTDVSHGWMSRLWLTGSSCAHISSITWWSSATQYTRAITVPSYRAWVTLRLVGDATLIMEGTRWAGLRIGSIRAEMSRWAGIIQEFELEVHIIWVVAGYKVFYWCWRLWSLCAVVSTIAVAGWLIQAFPSTKLSSWTICTVFNRHQT